MSSWSSRSSRTVLTPLVRRLAGVAAALLLVACQQGPWERACPEGDECEEGDECDKVLGYPSYSATHSICAPRCTDDSECPAPEFGDAEPRCASYKRCE